MKKIVVLTILLAGAAFAVSAQQAQKNPASAEQKAKFTPAEEMKLEYISKQQEMAAQFYRNKATDAKGFYKEVLTLMDKYISTTTDANKVAKMTELRDKVRAAENNFESSFSDIYGNTKMFITLL